MEMGDKAVDVGSPDVVKDRLLGVLLGEPETMLRMDNAPFHNGGYLGLHYDLAELVLQLHPVTIFDTKTLRVFGIDLNQGIRIHLAKIRDLFALRMEVAVSPCASS